MTEAAAQADVGRQRGAAGLFYGWWVVVAGAGLQLVSAALLASAFGSYVVLLRDQFGWSKTTLSAASSLRELVSGGTGLAQASLIERLGPRRVCQLGVVVLALGFVLFSQVQNVAEFFGAFFVMSVGASLCGYITVTYTAVQWFERRRATAIALTTSGFALGGVAVRLTVLLLEGLGWRQTALLSAAIVLVLGLALCPLIRWRPEQMGLEMDGGPARPRGRRREAAPVRPPLPGQDFTLREAVRTRAFWFISFGHASALFVVSAMNVHLVSQLKEGLGYSLGYANTVLLGLPILLLVGTLAGGPLGDRLSKRGIAIVCMFMHAGGLLLLAHASNLAMVLGFEVLHGLAWGLRGPLMAALRADYFGRSEFGKILGASNAIIIVGTISGPLIAGAVYDMTGQYRVGFDILAAIAAAGSVFFMLAARPERGEKGAGAETAMTLTPERSLD
ncbi:MAG: MFS transporter [Dehalococcoidia bacterium]|nr:MFS transporter [Dehalococcoidia bacterium]